jgi:hypothetical protein
VIAGESESAGGKPFEVAGGKPFPSSALTFYDPPILLCTQQEYCFLAEKFPFI